MTSPHGRRDWPTILTRARQIVEAYDTRVTLRQLFYRLVSEGVIPNAQTAYQQLSAYTAKARRDHAFPSLIDQGRGVEVAASWDGPREALDALLAQYRRDRTAGQAWSVYLGVEKQGLVELLKDWFGERGLPILALRGFSSQSFIEEVVGDVASRQRPAVLLYGGDWDPSGEAIDRDFIQRCNGCWSQVHRIALTADQVQAWGLPEMPGKHRDSRAGQFIARHGHLAQVELDAVPPERLRELFETALAPYWNDSTYQAVRAQEDEDREVLRQIA